MNLELTGSESVTGMLCNLRRVQALSSFPSPTMPARYLRSSLQISPCWPFFPPLAFLFLTPTPSAASCLLAFSPPVLPQGGGVASSLPRFSQHAKTKL